MDILNRLALTNSSFQDFGRGKSKVFGVHVQTGFAYLPMSKEKEPEGCYFIPITQEGIRVGSVIIFGFGKNSCQGTINLVLKSPFKADNRSG